MARNEGDRNKTPSPCSTTWKEHKLSADSHCRDRDDYTATVPVDNLTPPSASRGPRQECTYGWNEQAFRGAEGPTPGFAPRAAGEYGRPTAAGSEVLRVPVVDRAAPVPCYPHSLPQPGLQQPYGSASAGRHAMPSMGAGMFPLQTSPTGTYASSAQQAGSMYYAHGVPLYAVSLQPTMLYPSGNGTFPAAPSMPHSFVHDGRTPTMPAEMESLHWAQPPIKNYSVRVKRPRDGACPKDDAEEESSSSVSRGRKARRLVHGASDVAQAAPMGASPRLGHGGDGVALSPPPPPPSSSRGRSHSSDDGSCASERQHCVRLRAPKRRSRENSAASSGASGRGRRPRHRRPADANTEAVSLEDKKARATREHEEEERNLPREYCSLRERFLQVLADALRQRRHKPPGQRTLGYKRLDLLRFYCEVQKAGGSHNLQVPLSEKRKRPTWASIWRVLPNFHDKDTAASNRLRKAFEQYLCVMEDIEEAQLALARGDATSAVSSDGDRCSSHHLLSPPLGNGEKSWLQLVEETGLRLGQRRDACDDEDEDEEEEDDSPNLTEETCAVNPTVHAAQARGRGHRHASRRMSCSRGRHAFM